jgi:hypothetical protein
MSKKICETRLTWKTQAMHLAAHNRRQLPAKDVVGRISAFILVYINNLLGNHKLLDQRAKMQVFVLNFPVCPSLEGNEYFQA